MKTLKLKNILAIIAISTFLFACEADSDIYEDENTIEEVKAEDVNESSDVDTDNGDAHE